MIPDEGAIVTIKPSKVQAREITYELHSLGWKAFQNLCITITSEVWGQVVQSFYDSYDGGRDGAFHGTWKAQSNESFQGAFTVQCKFTANKNKILKLSDLDDELIKASRLAERKLANTYVLFTNARLTGVNEEKISMAFKSVAGIEHFAAYGCDWISRVINESSKLRMLVPRVYGLGDLSQILDERAYAQAQDILSSLGSDLAKFVITDAYKKSAKALVEHGFVLLLGEPACGKSTIAAALSMGALDAWACSTLKIRNADEFKCHWNPNEPKQLFWVDDAFGSTQFDWNSAAAWNSVFPDINAAIRKGAKVLFTSRDYIYRSAKEHLKESALPLMKESQVIIHVENLNKGEREEILYNHIRLGIQPREFKRKIKKYLPEVAMHRRFSPETARRLGEPIFTQRLFISESGLDDFVEHPRELLAEIIRTIDKESRSALALVFMRAGSLSSPVEMTVDEQRAVTLLNGSVGGVRAALNSLDGNLLINTLQNGSYIWRFKHPTIRDTFAAYVAEDRELMNIYLTGTPIKMLFSEVSCGDVGIQGVKVIVPADRYSILIERIGTFNTTKWEDKNALNNFLAFRCDREFFVLYVARNPHFISGLQVYSYLYAVSDVDAIVRLHEFGLLPETKRQYAVNLIRELAKETPDSGFMRKEIRDLLTPEEFDEILQYVHKELLPSLDDCIAQWRGNYSSGDDPENYFSELIQALKDYRGELLDYEETIEKIDGALAKINQIIEDLQSELPEKPDSDDFYSKDSLDNDRAVSRSIFDDVDQ